MSGLVRTAVKRTLMSLPTIHFLEEVSYYSRLGKWFRDYINTYTELFPDRYKLYDFLLAKYSSRELLYLEFGVYKGETIDYFRSNHKNSSSQFIGFDTFTGLPEDWEFGIGGGMKAGTFDTGGLIPKLDDSRVSFYKGLFSDTLPQFRVEQSKLLSSGKQLIIHIDADLYSSSLYVLTQLHDYLNQGAVVIFDEFSSVLHEFRALQDFTCSYNKQYQLLSYTDGFKRVKSVAIAFV